MYQTLFILSFQTFWSQACLNGTSKKEWCAQRNSKINDSCVNTILFLIFFDKTIILYTIVSIQIQIIGTHTSRVQFFNIEKRLHGNIYIWRLTLIITIKAAFWLLNDALR